MGGHLLLRCSRPPRPFGSSTSGVFGEGQGWGVVVPRKAVAVSAAPCKFSSFSCGGRTGATLVPRLRAAAIVSMKPAYDSCRAREKGKPQEGVGGGRRGTGQDRTGYLRDSSVTRKVQRKAWTQKPGGRYKRAFDRCRFDETTVYRAVL